MSLRVEGAAEWRWAGQPLCRRYVVARFNTLSVQASIGNDTQNLAVRWASGYLRDLESELIGVWTCNKPAIGLAGMVAAGDPPWTVPASQTWCDALVDLRRRGVERVQFVIGDDLLRFREELRAALPGATALPSFAELLERSWSQAAARHRAGLQQCLTEILQSASGLHARELLGAAESGPWGAKYPEILEDWRLALEQGWVLWTLPPALRRAVLSGDGAAAALNRSLRKAVARHGCFADVDEAHAFVVAALARAERRLQASRANAVTEHNHHREGFRPRMDALGV